MEQSLNSRTDNEQSLFPVQDVLFPRRDFPAELYLQCNNTQFQIETPNADDANMDLTIAKGGWISTNTYFNAFYLAYWSQYTNICDLTLSIKFSGALNVSIFHHLGNEKQVLVKATTINSNSNKSDTALIEILDIAQSAKSLQSGRITFEFSALENTTISSIEFLTSTRPRCEISLSIGICTFNQEKYLVNTLKEVCRQLSQNQSISKVFVVNQGEKFTSSDILTIHNHRQFYFIEQPNLGGCGGFTRTIFEAQKSLHSLTHHLLMDDDTILDGRIITRSIRFLSYLKNEQVLGGSMLDSVYPSTLHEAGALLDKQASNQSVLQGLKIDKPENLSVFDELTKTSYNAWWYCILPLKKIKNLRLPAPVFIRGDDIEFGTRLAQAGINTVSLPGVALWHEPFYLKPPGWHQYYGLRNKLILIATYQDQFSFFKITDLNYYLMDALLTHNYRNATFLRIAIKNYLDGPDALFAINSADRHKIINNCGDRYPVKSLSSKEATSLQQETGKPRCQKVLIVAYILVRRSLAIIFLPYSSKKPKVVQVDDAHINTIGNFSYVLSNQTGSFNLLFKPNRWLFIKGLIATIALTARYVIKNKKSADDWNIKISRFQTTEFWEKYFNPTK